MAAMTSEKIVYTCACGQRVSAPAALAGKRARCPACGRISAVPEPGAEEAAAAPAGPIDVEPGTLAGRVCSICQTAIGPGPGACLCPVCRSPYHRECWNEIGGCATYGCDLMPQAVKPTPAEGPQAAAWGDDKVCPQCGQTIRSAAVRCRFCRASFPSAVPMTPAEYQEWRAKHAQVAPMRQFAIALFAVSLIGVLAPLVLLVGLPWVLGRRAALHRAGGMPEILAYFGLALSVVYCIILLVVIASSGAG